MFDRSTLALIVIVGLVVLFVAVYTLWHILHFILCKKYDDLLFKQPIFNPSELGIYSVWPFSLTRSMGYILLLAAPNFFITKRRFKDITIDRSNIFFLVLFSRIFLFLIFMFALFFLFMVLWSISDMIFLDLDEPSQPLLP